MTVTCRTKSFESVTQRIWVPFWMWQWRNKNSHRHWLCHMLKLFPPFFQNSRTPVFLMKGIRVQRETAVFFVWLLLLCISRFVEYHMMFPELWILKRYLTKHNFVTGRRWFGSPGSQGQTSAFSQILALSAVSIGTAVEPQNSRRWNLTGYTRNCIDTIWYQIPDLFTTSQLCWRKKSNLIRHMSSQSITFTKSCGRWGRWGVRVVRPLEWLPWPGKLWWRPWELSMGWSKNGQPVATARLGPR